MTHIDDNNLNENKINNKTPRKRKPVWLLVLTDIALAAVCLGVFSLYQIVLPQKLASADIVVVNEEDLSKTQFDLPNQEGDDTDNNNTSGLTQNSQDTAADNNSGNAVNSPKNDFDRRITVTVSPTTGLTSNAGKTKNVNNKYSKSKTDTNKKSGSSSVTDRNKSNTGQTTKENTPTAIAKSSKASSKKSSNRKTTEQDITPISSSRQVINGHYTNYGNTGTDSITANKEESAALSSNKKVKTKVNSYKSNHISFTTKKIEIGTGNDKITCYVSDIYLTNVKYLKTAFAEGTYGKNIIDSSLNMAKDNKALLSLSGDFYGNSENSVVIRNGVLYRKTGNDADVCVLFTDGTMKTYSPDKFNAKELIQKGAWQAWTFGPALLDGKGKILKSFNTTDYLYGNQPRSCIGYVKPGHYVFAVVDGRDAGYSRGASLNELAQIMVDAGCMTAYNLDGGKSASMVYDNKYVNQPAQSGRDISDIIYIGE